jgi:uncharacterized protein
MRWLLAAITSTAMVAPSLATAGEYAPLDCAKANSPAEKTICKSYALGQSEARTATLFGIATSLVAMGQRGDIKEAQRKWLQTREACTDRVPCLTESYAARIGELNGIIDGIASRGPY